MWSGLPSSSLSGGPKIVLPASAASRPLAPNSSTSRWQTVPFPLVPVTPVTGTRQPAPSQLELVDDRHAEGKGARDGRGGRRDAGALDHAADGGRALEQLDPVGARDDLDTVGPHARDRLAGQQRLDRVARAHLRRARVRGQRRDGGATGPAQADHEVGARRHGRARDAHGRRATSRACVASRCVPGPAPSAGQRPGWEIA